MKTSTRRFFSDILNHCYQRTVNRGLLFYSVTDFLVLFTIVCVNAVRFGIKVYALCFMPDHIHGSYSTFNKRDLSGFVRCYTSEYATSFNAVCHRAGPLFACRFGSAPKIGDKKARTNIVYVNNNPVERRITKKAEDYRWNFLAYATSDHPYSEPIINRLISKNMKQAMAAVKNLHSKGLPVKHTFLKHWFGRLNKKESKQFADFIINTYNIIDYKEAARFFGGFDNMLTALHSTTGSEYDLNEISEGRDDSCFSKMGSLLLNNGLVNDIHEIVAMSSDGKMNLLRFLSGKTEATQAQIAKFLHFE